MTGRDVSPPLTPSSGPDETLARAWDALAHVDDPELRLDLVSLGLVYDVRDEEGTVVIEMTMTTPGCPAAEVLPEIARDEVAAALGDRPVEVRVVWDPPWDLSRIDPAAATRLGLRSR